MTDLPERVWVSPLGVFPVEMGGSVPYVPEQRALDAERDYPTLCLGEANASKDAAHEELAALREQVRVLTPLARFGWDMLETQRYGGAWPEQVERNAVRLGLIVDVPMDDSDEWTLTPDTAAARRIVEGT